MTNNLKKDKNTERVNFIGDFRHEKCVVLGIGGKYWLDDILHEKNLRILFFITISK